MQNTIAKTQSKPRAFFARLKKKVRFKRPYFAFPHLLIALIFVFVPLVFLLVNAFMGTGFYECAYTGTQSTYRTFTLDNFARFFTGAIWITLGRSLIVALLTTIFCLLFAYPLALALANSKINKSIILVLMFILPMYMNSLLRATAMRVLLDVMGMTTPNLALTRIIISHVYIFFPFMLLPIYTSLVNMDKSYIEASKDLGASNLSTFVKVTLPLSVPAMISGIFMVFMPVVSSFVIRDVMMQNIPGDGWFLFGNHIYGTVTGATPDGQGAALSIMLLIIVFGVMFGVNKVRAYREKKSGGAVS